MKLLSLEPESSASANSAIPAYSILITEKTALRCEQALEATSVLKQKQLNNQD